MEICKYCGSKLPGKVSESVSFFVSEYVYRERGCYIPAADFYAVYCFKAAELGWEFLTRAKFGRQLSMLGMKNRSRYGKRIYLGFAFNEDLIPSGSAYEPFLVECRKYQKEIESRLVDNISGMILPFEAHLQPNATP